MSDIYMKIKRSEYLEMKKTIQAVLAENKELNEKLNQEKMKNAQTVAHASAAHSEKATNKKGDK